MTAEDHENTPGTGGWQPTPQGEYDGEATAFVQLPPGAALDGIPLEAPGHGYVPPHIADPHATAHWNFHDALAAEQGLPPAPGPADLTGQWTIPVAQGDLPEESGEYQMSQAAAGLPWAGGATPPATLPGGAPAPWATPQEPQPEPEPEPVPSAAVEEPGAEDGAEPGAEAAHEASTGTAPAEAAPASVPAPATGIADSDEHPHISYVLRVNGHDRPVTEAWIGESLLYVLRERLGLAGAKDGCSQGECGACNVQVDGRLVASCLVPAATAAGSEVRTVEGLAAHGQPSDVQRALTRCGAVQCGFCIPGMAMTVHDLLERNHAPTELETRQALSGNLCRCTGYQGAVEAVRDVVAERAASAAAPDGPPEERPRVRIPHQVPHPHDGGTA